MFTSAYEKEELPNSALLYELGKGIYPDSFFSLVFAQTH